jgi:hypothetical protein
MGETTQSRLSPPNQDRPPKFEHQISEARMLSDRLERLSADSYWAHQASGLRGALLRFIALSETWHSSESSPNSEALLITQLNHLMKKSFEILVRGAQDIHR